ncbi:MAG: selenocysteine-specific translation elongation factor [Acidaminococcaceae bacterium]|jgi:selenocysteine-specific elongation factor|nr:selenocysteine-specific translation elongation factor [Acidaminococcaceae bacterium]
MKQTHIIVGTAGHVDHGKTKLTLALTGQNTDRLPEEKRRGLTIVNGFVPLDLKSGRRLGLIDVPGHEQFVKNMMAGVAGIDMALLVIAADEGVMPQTIEHLNILNLLGIHKGVVAITKSDLVDEEWLAMIEEDIKKLLSSTSLKDAPMIAVSANTGYHIEELKDLLDRVAATIVERPSAGLCRLPIDRVFTKQGFGTIITGTLWSGRIDIGSVLELLPEGVELRVRSIQIHGVSVEEAQAGQRTALNLTGAEVGQVKPGNWLCEPGLLHETHRVDVSFTLLKSAKALAKHTHVRIFHGTEEVLGRVRLLDREILQPGEECLCQLELEEALAPLRGDRMIIRSYSPVVTIAGATVLDSNPIRYKLSHPDTMTIIGRKANLDVGQGVITALEESGKLLSAKELAKASQLPEDQAGPAIADLQTMDKIESLTLDNIPYYYSVQTDSEWRRQIREALAEYHKNYPLRRGIPIAEFRQKIFKKISVRQFNALLEEYQKAGILNLLPGSLAAKPGFANTPNPAQQKDLETIMAKFTKNIFLPPEWNQVVTDLGIKGPAAQEYLGCLLDAGKIEKIGSTFFAGGTAQQAQDKLKAKFPKQFTIAEARDVWSTSRKFAQVILDVMDSQGITKREGDARTWISTN